MTYSLSPTKRLRVQRRRTSAARAPLALPAIDSVTGHEHDERRRRSIRARRPTRPASTTRTAGRSTGRSSNSMFLSVNGGYLGYGGHSEGGDYYHGVRRTFSTSNINYLDVPANLQQNAGYADNLSNTFSVQNDFSRFNVNVDATKFFNWKGQHSVKVGVQLERFGNSVNNGDQFPNIALIWNATRSTLSSTNVRGTYGYYDGDAALHDWRHPLEQHRPVRSGPVDGQQQADVELRPARSTRPTSRPIAKKTRASSSASATRSRRASASPTTCAATACGRRTAPGACSTTSRSSRCRSARSAPTAGSATTGRSTTTTGRRSTATALPTSNCPGTFIEQVDFRHVSNGQGADNLVDPNLEPYRTQEITFGMDRQLSRTISVGTRYTHKWLNQAIEDIGVQVPGVGEVFYIANPCKGLGEQPLGAEFPAHPVPDAATTTASSSRSSAGCRTTGCSTRASSTAGSSARSRV